jgi:hypothetical protein
MKDGKEVELHTWEGPDDKDNPYVNPVLTTINADVVQVQLVSGLQMVPHSDSMLHLHPDRSAGWLIRCR